MAFKMKGYSAFTKKTDPPKKKQPEYVIPRDESGNVIRTGNPPKSLLLDAQKDVDKYVSRVYNQKYPGKPRYLKNLMYKLTGNNKYLKK